MTKFGGHLMNPIVWILGRDLFADHGAETPAQATRNVKEANVRPHLPSLKQFLWRFKPRDEVA